jgi:hypothetical protein
MTNPYKNLKDYQFWRRSILGIEAHLFDPVVHTKFKISQNDKVATAGSCFAQHISRRLQQIGFNYYVAENGGDWPQEERTRRNFGVFTARYGNIYTTPQLEQLLEEAFGRRHPVDQWWINKEGRYIDPFRQQVEPGGFASPSELLQDRETHLAAVRDTFVNSDVFVFTLGLTEAWRSKVDGSFYPIAPGVNGGAFDRNTHEFVNLRASEVAHSLKNFLRKLKDINPSVKVLLTVSPVPLIATYEDRNVLTSTVYSKSALRVAAEEVSIEFEWVDYFPSYEIITSSLNGGTYYAEDFRDASPAGVSHVMRSFLRNYTDSMQDNREYLNIANRISLGNANVVCDEESLDALNNR